MQYKSLFILGRQPAIGRAELESLFGSSSISPIGSRAIGCTVPVELVDFSRLGGSIRLAEPLANVQTTKWPEIARMLGKQLSVLLPQLPEGKIKLGLSVLDLDVPSRQLLASGLELKKTIRRAGRSVRVVPNTEPELNSAQVLHNQLTSELGVELLIIRDGDGPGVHIARTIAVQDIEAYAARDQGRPKRDARVGMLPPKLAQIIINLAVSATEPSPKKVILDPFCGTGVVLQEALLMGYSAYGTDVDQRMVDYSVANVRDWFYLQNHPELHGKLTIALGDATSKTWEDDTWNDQKEDFDWKPAQIDFIASEVYLGRPFSAVPSSEVLSQTIRDVNVILKKFLQNVARQTKPGFRMCIAVPSWQTGHSWRHLPMLDHLDEMGYNRVSFEHARSEDLLYFRPDQIVARELLVITRE